MQAITYLTDKAWLCALGFQISTPLIHFVNTGCIYICLYNYEIHSMQCTLISVLICLWVCGWVILALDQPAVLWVELCDSLVPQHQYACSRIVAHLTGCDMDCMGCLFSIDRLSDFLAAQAFSFVSYTWCMKWFSGHFFLLFQHKLLKSVEAKIIESMLEAGLV